MSVATHSKSAPTIAVDNSVLDRVLAVGVNAHAEDILDLKTQIEAGFKPDLDRLHKLFDISPEIGLQTLVLQKFPEEHTDWSDKDEGDRKLARDRTYGTMWWKNPGGQPPQQQMQQGMPDDHPVERSSEYT